MQENLSSSTETGRFEFQKWSVYQEAIVLTKDARVLCRKIPRDGNRSLIDQLRRASQSVALNIAEGSSRFTRADKIQFLRVARGSVFECVAILDVIGAMEIGLELSELYVRLQSIGKMLSGFIRFIENEKPEKSRNP